ncbi:FAD-binding oxidoreductase [Porticoccaceae bacterium]|nr:FAD-binding oxidoreductase [Porticoccaceae bacterium]MDB2635087.1 FAD-binding oxidoreductase [Porticoccaceae bacterium]
MVFATSISQSLVDIVGPLHLLTDDASLQRFGVDRTTLWRPNPSAVVLPASVEEVQKIVRLANDENLAIVPSGGRTGLSGGSVAKEGELVVAMDRINWLRDFSDTDRAVTVGAGVVTAELQRFARQNRLFYPVDFASSGSSQVGGNVATNAGGIRVIRYGMTRDWITGLTVVTGGGEILQMNDGLAKNNTGYDFRHLFIGSEGTLGLICEARVQLTDEPRESAVLLLAAETFNSVLAVLKLFRKAVELTAFEFFSQLALDKVIVHQGLQAPFEQRVPFYVLMEFDNEDNGATDEVMALFGECIDSGLLVDGVMSQSLEQAKSLWRLREDISETLWQYQPYKHDISVLPSNMPLFVSEAEKVIKKGYPDFDIVWYGHIGDGNLHLNILKPASLSSDIFLEQCAVVTEKLGQLLQKHQGSISAEHGVGLLKRDYLHYSRSPEDIALMRGVKSVFDPKHVMNPGKLIPIKS